MVAIVKVFKNGRSQAVRPPKEFQFKNQEELIVKKAGNGILLLPKNDTNAWDDMFDSLDEFSDDFMSQRVQPYQDRENLF